MASKSTDAITSTGPDPAVIAALAAVSDVELAKYMSRFDSPAVPSSAKGKTEAKVAKVRKLDSETVSSDDGYTVVVTPVQGNGGIWRGGSRFQVQGKSGMGLKSLDRGALAAILENADAILAAMDAVDKRALLGSFLPADEKSPAAA